MWFINPFAKRPFTTFRQPPRKYLLFLGGGGEADVTLDEI